MESIEKILIFKAKAKQLIKFISGELRRHFREDVWLLRCATQQAQEKSWKIQENDICSPKIQVVIRETKD